MIVLARPEPQPLDVDVSTSKRCETHPSTQDHGSVMCRTSKHSCRSRDHGLVSSLWSRHTAPTLLLERGKERLRTRLFPQGAMRRTDTNKYQTGKAEPCVAQQRRNAELGHVVVGISTAMYTKRGRAVLKCYVPHVGQCENWNTDEEQSAQFWFRSQVSSRWDLSECIKVQWMVPILWMVPLGGCKKVCKRQNHHNCACGARIVAECPRAPLRARQCPSQKPQKSHCGDQQKDLFSRNCNARFSLP